MDASTLIQKIGHGLSAGAVAALALAVTAGSGPALAQEYKGKTLNVVVRSGPGGGNDFYARLIARHIGKHIPGTPETIVSNMPGGGGLVAANYLANRAKRDGTEFGILSRDLVVVQRIKAKGVEYDARKLIPIGNATSSTYVWVMKKENPINSLFDLKKSKKVMKFGGTGAGTASVQSINLFKKDGWPVEPISGYDGTAERVLAIVRGEIQGTSGSYGSLKTAIKDEGFKVIGRFGKHPDLKNVPDAREVLSERMRPLGALMAVPTEMGRPFYTTPEVPANRVKLLREGFRKALKDPKLLDEAKRAKRDIQWSSAEDIEKITEEILNAPDEVIDEFKAM